MVSDMTIPIPLTILTKDIIIFDTMFELGT